MIYILSTAGQIVQILKRPETIKLQKNKSEPADFVQIALSPAKEFLYACDEKGILHCFEISSGQVVSEMKASKSEVVCINHHPFSNMLLVSSEDGQLTMWK